MYLAHFGLRDLPFELTANPRFLYLTPRHREALANLQYGLSTGKALTVLVGEAGTGKTTLLRTALESDVCRQVKWVHVTNPSLTRPEFLSMLSRYFDLGEAASTSKDALLAGLEAAIRERWATTGQITALVVDEAQSLSTELLEEIRLLANLETDSQKLLPLVLAGQPEFAARLEDVELRQLKQRVALRCEISPFSLNETGECIIFRIRQAGGEATRMFSREAVKRIHDCAGGVPRTVCVLCDNALLTAFAMSQRSVTADIVEEVARDFKYLVEGPAPSGGPEIDVPDGPARPVVAPAQTEDVPAESASTSERRTLRSVLRFGVGS